MKVRVLVSSKRRIVQGFLRDSEPFSSNISERWLNMKYTSTYQSLTL